MLSTTRTSHLLRLSSSLRPIISSSTLRSYATQTSLGTTSKPSSAPRRRSVTPFNDDGRVPWGQLSPAEKAARTTQQSFNFGLIVLGTILTGGVVYVMYTEVFAPDSATNWFNRAVEQVKAHPQTAELLGDPEQIKAYGEATNNKWAVARPIASKEYRDERGTEHLVMHFNVEGPKDKGVVSAHLEKRLGEESEFVYKYLKLDVKGHSTVYLEGGQGALAKSATKMFGVKWR